MRTSLASLALAAALLTVGVAAPQAGAPKTVTGVDGPGFTISLKLAKKTVKVLPPATYIFLIHDKSNLHNFHLIGPGVNRKTGVAATGTFTWRLTLRRGTYRFICDPHKTIMKGKFVVQAP